MDYPATQMFVDDEEDEDEEPGEDEEGRTPLRPEKQVKFASIVIDSVAHPVYRGKDFVNKVGRIDSCTVVIDHNTISKEHAEIEAGTGPKSTFISDLGSMNKTKLNDVILRPGRLYQLRDGDNIRFGSVQAVFKLDESSGENDLARSRLSSEFVVPDTPALVPKTSRQVIPGTPDLSFDRSSLGSSRTSDVSMVAGTQEAGDPGGRTSPRFSRRVSSRGPTPGAQSKANTSKTSLHDISDLETQNDLSLEDSDEENIFDMLTQQSDIHDEKTQRFSKEKIHVVKPARFSADGINVNERHSPSIEDMETQKFFTEDKIKSKSYSINDVETQKFSVGNAVSDPCSINDLETQKFTTNETGTNCSSINDLETQKISAVGKQAPFPSINDLETQKFSAGNLGASSINDLETQKFGGPSKNAEDSETDEEGIFEDSTGSDGIDMFDAPTQLIRPPRSPKKTDNTIVTSVGEEMTQRHISKPQEIEERIAERQIESPAKVKSCTEQLSVELNGEAKATLNDSIESKLNNMFDDVNESRIEEPTQMLTQNLETILDSTQVSAARPDPDGAEDADTEDVQPAPGDDIAYSNHRETRKSAEHVVRVPRILTTPELFADLPAVNILSRLSGSDRERTETPSPLSIADEPAPSRISKTSEQGSSGARKTKIDKVDKNQSALSNGVGSKRSERSATFESKNSTPRRSTARGKSKARKDVSPVTSAAGRSEESEPAVEDESVQERNGKELPPKKRGRLAPPNPPASKKIVAIVTPTTRAGTKSNANVPVEIWQRSSRSSTVDGSKGADDEKPTSPVEPPSKRGKRDARSKKNDSSNPTVQPETISAPRTPSQRIHRKRLEKSAVVSDEEATPVKKARISKTALPQTVSDRRDKRRNATGSCDLETDQNDSPSTRTRRTRPAASTSTIDDPKSSLKVEASENRPQSSLESQEIQEILGIVGKDDHESIRILERMPSFHKEMRIFRSQETGNDRRKDGFRGFTKTEQSKETFEKPAEKTEAKKRPVRRTQASQKKDDDEDLEIAKPRGRSARISKIAKEENAEKKLEDPPPPAVVQQVSTPKRRATVTLSRLQERGRQKSAEPAPKRGRRKTAEPKKQEEPKLSPSSSSSSSPLRRGRSSLATPTSSVLTSPRTKHRILFTGLNASEDLISIINSLGGTITEKPNDCTALVTDKIRRTYKFLCGMAMAVPIVSVEWLTESERIGHFLNTGDFLLEDPVAEGKFKFNLRQSLTRATGGKLLEGFTLVLTPNTAPPPTAELKGMIQACGGKVLVRPPTKWPEKSIVISREEDAKNAKKYLAKAPESVHLVSVEFILTGILRHEVNLEEHKLEIQ